MLSSLLSIFGFMNRDTYSIPSAFGSSGIDMGNISAARRKARRGKMYRRYRGRKTSIKVSRQHSRSR